VSIYVTADRNFLTMCHNDVYTAAQYVGLITSSQAAQMHSGYFRFTTAAAIDHNLKTTWEGRGGD